MVLLSCQLLRQADPYFSSFKFNKRYFWLGDEAISTQNLSHYLRGTEPRIAQPIAAWSSHTGKGLLYFVKSESEKSHPHDVLCLVRECFKPHSDTCV